MKEALLDFVQKTQILENAFSSLEERFLLYENSYQFLERIFSHLPLGVLFVSREGKILFFNRTAEELLDYTSAELVDHYYADFFSDTLFGFSIKQQLREKGKKNAFIQLNKGTTQISLETHFVSLNLGLLLTLKERTQDFRVEKSLEQNENLKNVELMGAQLAHEIRNPLAGIEGFAQLLARDLKEDPVKLSMVEAILKGTSLLNRLVTQVLDYAKPLQVHLTSCDLHKLIKDTLRLASAGEKEGRIFHFKTPLTTVLQTVDKDLLQMALLNLLKNAQEASPPYSSITISLAAEKELLTISVEDEGPGIAPEIREKIFTPFFTTKAKGTGIGLAQVHKVITAHGGKIEVENVQPNGTLFRLTLPYGQNTPS